MYTYVCQSLFCIYGLGYWLRLFMTARRWSGVAMSTLFCCSLLPLSSPWCYISIVISVWSLACTFVPPWLLLSTRRSATTVNNNNKDTTVNLASVKEEDAASYFLCLSTSCKLLDLQPPDAIFGLSVTQCVLNVWYDWSSTSNAL